MSVEPIAGLRCSQITKADLGAVIALLCKGFKHRSEAYWRDGFARHERRPLPEGYPIYGYMLKVGDEVVGTILTLHSNRIVGAKNIICCNIASWYVDPAYRSQSILLEKFATRRPDVVYLNVTPAPHTWPIIETRGYIRFCMGQMLVVPLLSRKRRGAIVRLATLDDPMLDLSALDRGVVLDHLGIGCIALVCTDAEGTVPLIFRHRTIGIVPHVMNLGRVSCVQLVYAQAASDVARFASAIGRRLLISERTALIAMDATGPVSGLKGRYFHERGPKYVRGAASWPLGDLAYTEFVLFGP